MKIKCYHLQHDLFDGLHYILELLFSKTRFRDLFCFQCKYRKCVHWGKSCQQSWQLLVDIWAISWENLFMPYANNKGADQPAYPQSLISAFVVRCLGSTIPLLAIAKISRPLASLWRWAGRLFESYLAGNPKDRYSHDVAHMIITMRICKNQKNFKTRKNRCRYPKIWTIWFYQRDESKRCRQNDEHCKPWSECSRSTLIWLYTVCPDLYVRKLRIIMV